MKLFFVALSDDRPYPLLEHEHVVYYDNANKTELFEKLDQYRGDSARMARVAAGGYLHAMTHHRAACLLDYVLRSVHTMQLQETPDTASTVNYVYTAQQMRQLALDSIAAFESIPSL